VRPVLVDQHLTQGGTKTPGFEVGQLDETPAGQFDLDDLVRSPTQVQRGPLPVAITAGDRTVLPSEPTKQRRGRHRVSGSPHSPGLFLIMPRPCFPVVAIACRSVGLGHGLPSR
jgi:hypothetical protein